MIETVLTSWNDNYPFSKDISDQSGIIYHATNSNFMNNIEKYGWYENSQPYDLNDIRYLCDTYDKFFFTDKDDMPNELDLLDLYYRRLKRNTLRYTTDPNFKKENCFTANYENALAYACHLYGETLKDAFLFIDQFINVLNSHINSDMYKTICLEEDKANIILNLNNIKNKYMNLVSNSYPIIYAIKGRNEWFDSVDLDSSSVCEKIDLKTNSHIPPESILAKVEFLDGFKIP